MCARLAQSEQLNVWLMEAGRSEKMKKKKIHIEMRICNVFFALFFAWRVALPSMLWRNTQRVLIKIYE